jgi:acetyl-CoA acetyltransferase
VAAGEANSVLVVAAEQMRLLGRDRTTQVLQGLIHEDERRYGVTMPALGALLEGSLLASYPGLAPALEELMFANRARAVFNPRAHIRKEFRRADARGAKNPLIATPLRLWDVAPTSSGFAAMLLSCDPPKGARVEVQVAGLGHGHDAVALSRRRTLHRSAATREALQMLLEDLGWQPAEIRRRVRYAEIHDAFPVIEFLGLLDTGLLEPDEIIGSILGGELGTGGRLPVNQSGGVMGGHPVGATGLGQIVELYLQATGGAGKRPEAPRLGYSLAFNVGGPLTYNFLTLLRARPCTGLRELFWLPRRAPLCAADFDLSAPAPPRLPCAGRLLARTELHVPPPGFEGPLPLALVEVEGHAYLASCPRGFRPGSRIWLEESRGRLVVRTGPGVLDRSQPASHRGLV